MATRTSAALFPDNSTDAHFRAWVQFIEDTLVTTGGWVVTGDTGQMTISTALHPTVGSTKVGYRIYRMADSLQATSPVFMKLFYGSGAGAANNPGIWVVIGTGSDGAGNITNARYDDSAVAAPTIEPGGNSAAVSTNSYGSADTGRFSFALFQTGSNADQLAFSLERSKDSTGAETGDGLLFIFQRANNNVGRSAYIVLGSAVQPPVETTGVAFIIAGQNPSSFGSDLGVGIIMCFKGSAQQPGPNMGVIRSSDFTAETTFTMTVYGNVRTFLVSRGGVNQGSNNSSDANNKIVIRYD